MHYDSFLFAYSFVIFHAPAARRKAVVEAIAPEIPERK
jgi:hypothetical protein